MKCCPCIILINPKRPPMLMLNNIYFFLLKSDAGYKKARLNSRNPIAACPETNDKHLAL